LRVVAGLALILLGLLTIGGVVGISLAIIGVIPLLAGLLDVCLIGWIFMGTPLKGAEVRQRVQE
jgi:hypothetical protein